MSKSYVEGVIAGTRRNHPHEPEFLQAVEEVLSSLSPSIEAHPEYREACVLERLVEPERAILFRVPWTDDRGDLQVNRGYRVQFNSSLGPYKGGLRFHPSVNLSILKFLGFEQILKNSLTQQNIGGAKGGSDFDPKGKTDGEVMRFCQSFMLELERHIGADTDVPAGDIGVGSREIGYLFGQYKRLATCFEGVLTGKSLSWGGSLLRPEATGYGVVYFAQDMLQTRDESLNGKTCLVSGSGNVAQYVVEKLNEIGARVVTMSDSDGFIHDPDGIDREKLEWIMDLKNNQRGRIHEYARHFKSGEFTETPDDADSNPLWCVPAECAFPCATQNEIHAADAANLLENGVSLICEGANMPCTIEATHRLIDAGTLLGPAKASNAGGVAVSALEMAQNSQREQWSRDEVDERLREIMKDIHDTSLAAAQKYGRDGNYVDGANIAGFERVARAMLEQGYV